MPAPKLWLGSTIVFGIALSILTVVTFLSGAAAKFPAGSDPDQYLAIGRSLAAGNGFKDTVGFWPNAADYSRMPGWPTIIALGLRLFPSRNPEMVVRVTNAVCLSVVGAFFFLLSRRLGVRAELSIVAGLAVSLSPALVPLSIGGLSEISFLMIVAVGLTALLAAGRSIYFGALILGTATLVRTNFVLVPLVFLILVFAFRPAGPVSLKSKNLISVSLAFFIAFLPTIAWMMRNDFLTNRFPLLSAIEGETLYGSNNDVVARDLDRWGYWIMPDEVPGEIPKRELAHRLGSELALNDYYHAKGMAWLKANLRALPRLELGKFVRAFVPIPWRPVAASYVAFSYRFLLWVLWLLTLPYWIRGLERVYLLLCMAMAVVHVITTTIYYGTFRFTHCYMEVFFIPAIAYGFQEWRAGRRLSRAHAVEPSYTTV